MSPLSGFPRSYWVLWTGTLVNRMGSFVLPFLSIYLTEHRRYIVYKSRRDRDRVNAMVMKDPRLADMMDPKAMPFDGKRLIFGGFKTTVDV